MFWALKAEMAARYERAVAANPVPSDAQLRAYSERRATAALAASQPECLTIAGDVAQITVDGLLTPQPDLWAWFVCGNTAYSDIRDALASAELNPVVQRIEWTIASPGGMVDGLFETLAAIESSTKPSNVRASMACSAAYALAAMAGKIEATSPASEFGSVGVVRTYYADGPAAQELSIDVTSTAAPNKRPDVTTPEGQATVRGELDVQHDLLVDAIARGRTRNGTATSPSDVNAKFGQGGSVFAEGARAAGMIDVVPPRSPQAARSSRAALPSVRSDASALAELFGAKRDDETDDEYVERFAAFAAALTPSAAPRREQRERAGGDAGDMMADAMGLPPDPARPDAARAAVAAKRSEYHQLLAAQLGLSNQAASQLAFPDPPSERPVIALEFSVPAAAPTPTPTPAPTPGDAGDAMADAMGLPRDPENSGDRLATAIEALVSRFDGETSPTPQARGAQSGAMRAQQPHRPRADDKDAGDLMADAMGLPPDREHLAAPPS
jgi:ClpP class serine protease